MIWTTDMDAMLVAGREAGLSSFEIAARIGSPITASAVRSRRVDLGLPPRDTATLVLAGQFKSAYRQPVKAAPQVVDRPGPQSDPKPFADRGRWECAFIVAEDRDGMRACCGPVRPGSPRPYCGFHLDLTGAAHAAA